MTSKEDSEFKAMMEWIEEQRQESIRVEAAGPYPCPKCGVYMVKMPREVCSACVRNEERRASFLSAARELARLPKWPASWLCFLSGPRTAPDGRTLEAICGKRVVAESVKALDAICTKNAPALNLVLLGPTGAGKSVLATHLAVHAVIEGKGMCWASAIEIGASRRDAGLGRTPEILDDAKRAGVLLLDDLGQEDNIGRQVVNELMHERYDDSKPTVITTGFDSEWVAERYGAQLARRVFEMSFVLKMSVPRNGKS